MLQLCVFYSNTIMLIPMGKKPGRIYPGDEANDVYIVLHHPYISVSTIYLLLSSDT